ncbi:MAG: right-handed parallel beta-helix repeat-containing protein [Patescibacteria group bacterium]|jgi:parallel beta-helix repeat protein|nr:right-handed parallel beta-helix repeat-containing protein [Patescibacteria group bacterium]
MFGNSKINKLARLADNKGLFYQRLFWLSLILLALALSVRSALAIDVNAQITPSRLSCTAPCAIFFQGWQSTPTGQIAKWEWDFGTGTENDFGSRYADGFNAAHVFEQSGVYNVSLKTTALDSGLQEFSDTATVTITVNPRTGATYYIDSQNGNDNNSGTSQDDAWASADHALTVMKGLDCGLDGCRFLFKRGQTFNFDKQYSLNSRTNNILIGAYGDSTLPKPIFKYTADVRDVYILYFGGAKNITLEDINFVGNNNAGSLAWNSATTDMLYLRVDLNNFYRGFLSLSNYSRLFLMGLNASGGSGSFNFVGQSGSYLAMVGNTIDDIGFSNCQADECHANYLESINNAGLIYHNVITRVTSHSLRISGKSNNVYVGGNIITNAPNYTLAHPSWLLVHIGCNNNNDNDCNANNILVEKNYFGYARRFLNINSANNVTVRNNIMVAQDDDSSAAPITVGSIHSSIDDEVPSKNIKIVNNTIIFDDASSAAPIFSVGGRLLATGQLPPHENIVFSNNLIKTNLDDYNVPASLSGQVNTANNVLLEVSQASGMVNDAILADITAADYSLLNSSPAVNAGRGLGVDSAYDFTGKKRDSSPDAGAYEANFVPTGPTIYYVDAALGSDSNSGLASSPWRTIQKAADTAQPGDEVIVKAGDYRSQGRIYIKNSGTSQQGIIFRAEGSVATKGFTIFNKDFWQRVDYVTVKGFEVTDTISDLYDGTGILVYGSNNIIEGNYIHHTQRQGIYVYAQDDDANGNLIINNVITNTGLDGDPLGSGIKVYGVNQTIEGNELRNINIQTILDLYLAKNSTVKSNNIHDNGSCIAALALWSAANNVLEGNSVHDNNCQYGVLLTQSSNNLIKANTVSKILHHDTFQGSGIVVYEQSNNNQVIDNQSFANSHVGVAVFNASDNQVAGNEIYQNGGAGVHVGGDSSRNLIEKNEIYQNAQQTDDVYGIDLLQVGYDNIVRYNQVYNQHDTYNDPQIGPNPGNPEGSPKYGSGAIRFDGGSWVLGSDHHTTTGNKIYYNVVHDEYIGIEVFNFDNIEIYNNTVYASKYAGLHLSSYDLERPVEHLKVKNNIVYNTTPDAYLVFSSDIANNEINNNLYYQTGAGRFLRHWNELDFAAWQLADGNDQNSIFADPLFVNPAANYFELNYYSPAIDRGVELGLDSDYAGNIVPQGAGTDIGAYEAEPSSVSASLEYTYVPKFGDSAGIGILYGRAEVSNPQNYSVMTYIKVGGVWYPKPNVDVASEIQANGTWISWVMTHPNDWQASEIKSFLIPRGIDLPDCYPELCLAEPEVPQAVAQTSVLQIVGENPTLEYTFLPNQAAGQEFGLVYGKASQVNPAFFKVMTYIKVGGVWYSKPNVDFVSDIKSDGTWIAWVMTNPNDWNASEIVSVLVPLGAELPDCYPDLCLQTPAVPQAIAQVSATLGN